jgi:hypothetical protein
MTFLRSLPDPRGRNPSLSQGHKLPPNETSLLHPECRVTHSTNSNSILFPLFATILLPAAFNLFSGPPHSNKPPQPWYIDRSNWFTNYVLLNEWRHFLNITLSCSLLACTCLPFKTNINVDFGRQINWIKSCQSMDTQMEVWCLK